MRGLFHRVLSAASLLVAMSCGGGGGSSGSTPTPPASVLDPSGIWAGSVHSNSANQNYAVNAVILPDGTFRYAAVNLVQAFGTLSVQGNALTGVGTMISLAGAWMQSAPIQVSCTGTSRGSMSGTFSGADTGTISLSYVPSANIPIALSDLASGYMDDGSAVSSGHRTNLIVTSTGVISGTDANGTFAGQLSQPFSSINAFRVTLSYSDGSAQGPYSYTGLCFWGPDAKRMYFELSDTRSGLSAKGQWMGSLAAAPGISEFRSVSPIITNGTGTSLNWTVSGASSLSIDHGIGSVTGQTNINIAPTSTTTYTLTATNVAGISVTAQTTVVVVPPPVITAFNANPSITNHRGSTSLSAIYSGGTAVVNPGNLSITTGGTVTLTNLTSNQIYTLTVTNTVGMSVSADATVTISTGMMIATGSLNTGRQMHTATLLLNGKVLTTGGFDGSSTLANAELYDPDSEAYSPPISLGKDRYDHSATVLPGGKVLVTGGMAGTSPSVPLASAELFDPFAGTFSATGTMTSTRYLHSATLLPNGKVLIAGGSNGSGTLATAELFDPSTGIFSATGIMASTRSQHTATLLLNGKVLIAGGYQYLGYGLGFVSLANAELYDPSTGIFTPTGSMSTGRNYHTATLLSSGKVLIAGSFKFDSVRVSALASTELYDPALGLFSTTSSMGTGRYQHLAILLPNGKVLIVGGWNGGMSVFDSTELFDPVTGTFRATGSMISPRYLHSATLLPSGKVLIEGGRPINNFAYRSAELYDSQDPAPGFPSISFNPSAYAFHLGVAIPAITPNSTGATIWNINPALSSGLNFNTGTGVITGIPTATNSSQAYQISASNGTNSTSAYLWILVIP